MQYPAANEALYFCIAFRSPDADTAGVAEACLRFTPDLAVRRDARPAVFLEASRCRALYSPRTLEARLRVLLREFRFSESDYRIAEATSLPRAWLCASHGILESAIDAAPISAIAELFDPLGEEPDEQRKIGAMIEVLFMLGIRRIGALRTLPPDSAVSRFGALYQNLLEQVGPRAHVKRGAGFSWARFRPTEKFLERIDLDPDQVIWDLEPVLFHTKSLIDRILKRAFGRGKALAEIELRIECEKRRDVRETFTKVRIRFTFPQSDPGVVLRTLREKLSYEFGKRELEAPIIAIEFEACELTPRNALQSDFIDREQSSEGFRELVSELGTKLSLERELYQAELSPVWRPEKSWQRVLKDPASLIPLGLPIPGRPLTLFTPPEPLRRLGRYFFHSDNRYAIQSYSQVERLSGEWWEKDGGFTRTYYRVKVRADEGDLREFWIFREQKNADEAGGIFLHGIF